MVEQLIREGLAEVDEVKRWIDNDVAAGDEAISVHADALERAREKFEAAREEALRLQDLTGPDYHVVDHRGGDWGLMHPLECRAGGLLNCPVHHAFMRLDTPEVEPGRWRVDLTADGELTYTAIEEGTS